MKKFTTLISFILLCATALFGQVPENFTYQAVVRNASNALVANAQVGVRVNILQGTASGNAVYSETHIVNTNANGLVTVNIGGGSVLHGSLTGIDWSDGPYFLKTDIDPNGGNDYSITSVQQLLSVPYALYAKEAANSFSGDYNDLTNAPAIPTVPANVSAFANDAGYITGYTESDPQYNAWDKDYNDLINKPTIPTVPTNVSAFTNDAGYITGYTETDPQYNAWDKDYNDLINKPTIPTVPTNVSAFTNDVGYITGYTETDPQYNAWDKDYNDLINKPTIPTVPTNVSAFNNDSGYLTTYTETDPQYNAWDKDYNDLINKPTIPTVPTNVSAFTNDAGYLSYYTETQTLADVTAQGNSAGYRQLKNVSDPTDNLDAVNLRTLISQINALQDDFQQQMQQMQQQMQQMQHQIDSLQEIVNPLDTNHNTAGDAVIDEKSCPSAPTVTDHEGNVYATVQIGNQCWMRDNLRTTTSPSTGTYLIPAAGTGYTYSGKQAFWYNNDSATYAPQNYGLLYNWNAAVDTFNTAYGETSVNTSSSNAVTVMFNGHRRGICPAGWHLPSDTEWIQLTDYVSSHSEYTCGGMNTFIARALASTTNWSTCDDACSVGNDQSTNNATGFSAVPAGESAGSSFDGTGLIVGFWSSTQYSGDEAWERVLMFQHMGEVRINIGKYLDFSVRCLRDAESGGGSTAQLPSVTTTTLSNITSSTATCGGIVTSDGGATVTAYGVCWSTSQNPTVSGNHTFNGTGMGSFTSNLTGLVAGTTYYVRAYAINNVGTAYGNEVSFTALSAAVVDEKSCPAALTVTDHEGNVYATVQIGNQCWMRDNLRTSTSPSTGTYLIPVAGTYHTYTGKQACWYDNNPATYALQNYGLLYNWNAAVDTFNTAYGETSVNWDYDNSVFVSFTGLRRGICPAGWHLPSDTEWTQLTNFVKSQSPYMCGSNNTYIAKALASNTGWNNSTRTCAVGNDQSANNAVGFSAIPAGGVAGVFISAGVGVSFWSTRQNSIYPRYYSLNYDEATVLHGGDYGDERAVGLSVRCLRDETGGGGSTATMPTVTTNAVSGIMATSVTCGGNVTSDGGASVTARGVCWSTSQNPMVSDSHTSDGSGTGSFSSSITGLTANTTYYVRAYATNSEGTAYGAEVSFTTIGGDTPQDGHPCPSAPTVTDHEGNVYATVQIGNQCWMRDNLRTTTSPSTGTYLIPAAGTGYTYSGKQAFWYNNDSATYAPMNYGLLYNWNAAVDTFNTAYGETSVNATPSNAVSVSFTCHHRGICPVGWHLPSDAEWNTMEATVSDTDWQASYETSTGYRGSHAGKLAGGDNWTISNTSGAPGDYGNADRIVSGFTAVPAGICIGSSFNHAGFSATFWSSSQSESSPYYAWNRNLGCYYAGVYRGNYSKYYGYSVRCLRD